MKHRCRCKDKDFYRVQEAKIFFSENEWMISHITPENAKILQCASCLTKWDFKYVDDIGNFEIRKKYKKGELILGKIARLSIWNSDFRSDFDKVNIVRVIEDEFAIVELSEIWNFQGNDIKYLLIRNRTAGYLSDLLLKKTLSIDANYLPNKNTSIEQISIEDYSLKWLGSIEVK
jgi:hypothetical protein